VFGGYTSLSWSSGGSVGFNSKSDSSAFLIRIVSPYNTAPVLFPSTSGIHSVSNFKAYGPWFGAGICVAYQDTCYTHIDGSEYINSTGLRSDTTMTGHWAFIPDVIEVYGL
jgi:hypothetical protein